MKQKNHFNHPNYFLIFQYSLWQSLPKSIQLDDFNSQQLSFLYYLTFQIRSRFPNSYFLLHDFQNYLNDLRVNLILVLQYFILIIIYFITYFLLFKILLKPPFHEHDFILHFLNYYIQMLELFNYLFLPLLLMIIHY